MHHKQVLPFQRGLLSQWDELSTRPTADFSLFSNCPTLVSPYLVPMTKSFGLGDYIIVLWCLPNCIRAVYLLQRVTHAYITNNSCITCNWSSYMCVCVNLSQRKNGRKWERENSLALNLKFVNCKYMFSKVQERFLELLLKDSLTK